MTLSDLEAVKPANSRDAALLETLIEAWRAALAFNPDCELRMTPTLQKILDRAKG